jgi:hypothetical protein
VDLSALTSLVDSEIVTTNLVVADSEIIIETPSKDGGWIKKRSQPLLAQKM